MRLLFGSVMVVTIFRFAEIAGDETDFRTIEVPQDVSICESAELLKRLSLTTEQTTRLNAILAQWKRRFLAARQEYNSRPEELRRGGYGQHRDRDLRDSISDLLNDQQYQLFHQMLTLWAQSPVQSQNAFQFELGLSGEQHRQLHKLDTQWILFALHQTPNEFRHQRHTEPSHRRIGELQAYRHAVTRLAWQFVPQREVQWHKIVRPEQARRWKERELELAFQLYQFDLLLADFSVCRQGSGQLNTGTWLDHSVPYFTPPYEALNWTKEQILRVRKLPLIPELQYEDRPNNSEERERWLMEHEKRSVKRMQQIEQIMTDSQRKTWWQLFGEPSAIWNRQLLEMRARSLINTGAVEAKHGFGRGEP